MLFGHGRRTNGIALVDPAGSPEEFGDAAADCAPRQSSLAKTAPPPVTYRGEVDRWNLLDDGFSIGLARDFDIVLITERDLRDSLLPGGRLRELLSSLSRASVTF